MRHVRDEIAADLIGAAQIGDVVQHQHDAVLGRAGGRRRAGDDRPLRVARRRELQRVGRPAEEHGRDELDDRREAKRLDVRPADADFVELQHLPRGVVHELQPCV